MGVFASPQEVAQFAMTPMLQGLSPEVLDERWIFPAERRIEEAFYLDLNTDYYPDAWIGQFNVRPRLIQKYQADYRRAVILLVDHWAANPQHLRSENMGGASAVHRAEIPPPVKALMTRWGKRPRIRRY